MNNRTCFLTLRPFDFLRFYPRNFHPRRYLKVLGNLSKTKEMHLLRAPQGISQEELAKKCRTEWVLGGNQPFAEKLLRKSNCPRIHDKLSENS
jgi:hypothetical protein